MRRTRLRKFGKRGRKLALLAQIAAIWYLSFAMVSYLTTDTGAYFNDVEVIKGSLHVNWEIEDEPEYPPDDENWGNSSLKEVSQGGSCAQGIWGSFTNTGSDVNHELTKYEVYWSEADGNVKNGKVVESGVFPIPDNGEEYTIQYQPKNNGYYKFKAYHETGHANGNGNGTGPWSGTIQVTDCENAGEDNKNVTEPPKDEVSPAKITNLAGIPTTNSITLSWNHTTDSDFKQVNIYRDGKLLTSIINSSTYEDKNLESNKMYSYKITTLDVAENESLGATIQVTTIVDDNEPPNEISSLHGTRSGSSSNLSLSWKNPTEDFSFVRIYIIGQDMPIKDNFAGEKINNLDVKTKDQITLRITTVDKSGNESEGVTIGPL
ncbi:amyloid fiber anchoring/assembly protein TapA [Fredinandcohnia salidurans]|uniref:Amyloid fiber anchoring/assembly protein TapA n=1 Tax=Fredinandcohnia salidurans TaxID=2595041 RepID=A0ABW4MUG6_9BACI